MADEEEGGEKTEEPTGRRISQARSQGTVPRSQDLSQVLALIAAFLALKYFAPKFWESMIVILQSGLSIQQSDELFTLDAMRHEFYKLLWLLLPDILLMLLITAAVGTLATAAQTQFLWSNKLLQPKWSNLNPVTGLMRLFTMQNAITLGKSLAKLLVIGLVAYQSFVGVLPQLASLAQLPLNQLLPYTGMLTGVVFWPIIKLLLLIAILDYIWQRYSVQKKLKMTKFEVKDERKALEGDEGTRVRIRSKGMQRIRQRLMQAIQAADVVVTNPTHFAVALQYSGQLGTAPKVVAKGRNYLAQRIKELAKEQGVPVIERKPLAQALYKMVEVGQEIPYELYTAVAELLAYVYRLTGRRPPVKNTQQQNNVS